VSSPVNTCHTAAAELAQTKIIQFSIALQSRYAYSDKDQLLLTNPHDTLYHGKRAEMLCVESCQFSATTPAFNLPHLDLVPLLGVSPFEFCRDFQHQKTTGPRLLFSRFSRTLTCDTRRQLIPALASVVRTKTVKEMTCNTS